MPGDGFDSGRLPGASDGYAEKGFRWHELCSCRPGGVLWIECLTEISLCVVVWGYDLVDFVCGSCYN